jgi:protein subunit release factor B
MGSILSAIRDDEDEYYDLYNAQRDRLKKRMNDEWQAKLQKERGQKAPKPAPQPKAPKKPERRTVAERILETMDDD